MIAQVARVGAAQLLHHQDQRDEREQPDDGGMGRTMRVIRE